MKQGRFVVVLSCMALFMGVNSTRADGFEFPNLNPFSSKAQPSRSRVSDQKPSGIALPTLPTMKLPTMRVSPARRNTPTTWQRMQKGTSQFFSSISPWGKTPRRVRAKKKPASNKSAFSWLFSPKKKQKEIRDVNDFLSLPRPDYD